MALIRALAIHLSHDLLAPESIDRIVSIADRVKKCLYKVKPWTLRLVFPVANTCKSIEHFLNDLFSTVDADTMVDIGFEGDVADINYVPSLLDKYKKYYASVRCTSDECIDRVVSSVYAVRDKNVDFNIYTKFALLFGNWIETPYFPATCNVSNVVGISASLRYVDLVEKALFGGSPQKLFEFIQQVYSDLDDVSRCSDMPFLGLDMSLSPWKDESIARIIEKLINREIGFPGTLNAINSLNRLIDGLIKKLKLRSIGFNEVMLPVAEDDILNERVKQGYTRLRDLVSYALVCVAGLDMVALPKTLDIRRLSVDMLTIHKIKRRSVAMRIIPVDQDPGTPIKLENFGITYVASP